MIETLSHPAQSAEFLSRLHDGELAPDEAVAFESHRRECEECRAAVADYEGALAAYRETAVTPHASDLSARILRKIRTASPSRRPFGVMFGIDVRWAGVLAAALLVVIIGAPVFRHRTVASPEEAPSGSRPPIPAYVLDTEEPKPAPARADADRPARMKAAPNNAAPPSAPAAAAPEAREFAIAPPSTSTSTLPSSDAQPRDEIASTLTRSNAAQEGKSAPPPAPAAPSLQAAAPAQAQAPASAAKESTSSSSLADRRRSASAPVGGEAGAGADEAAPTIEVKLVIQSADGGSETPEILRTPTDERLAALRGRKYLLVVEPGGRVVAAEEQPARGKLAKDANDKTEEVDAERAAQMRSLSESLMRELVFQAGDRSRRILVTVSVR